MLGVLRSYQKEHASSKTLSKIYSKVGGKSKEQKHVYFVLCVHLCALVYEWADTLWEDTHRTETSGCYRAVAAAWASGWEGASLSLQTPWYNLVLGRLITDYIYHLSIKYPQREGWQTQGCPAEAQPVRGEELWTQTPHHRAGSQWGPYLAHMPPSHPSRPKTYLSRLLFRSTLPFSFSTCNKESGKIYKKPKLRGSM